MNQPSQWTKKTTLTINQSINQPINQLINQSINQSINRSINQSISAVIWDAFSSRCVFAFFFFFALSVSCFVHHGVWFPFRPFRGRSLSHSRGVGWWHNSLIMAYFPKVQATCYTEGRGSIVRFHGWSTSECVRTVLNVARSCATQGMHAWCRSLATRGGAGISVLSGYSSIIHTSSLHAVSTLHPRHQHRDKTSVLQEDTKQWSEWGTQVD